jgi:TolB protein
VNSFDDPHPKGGNFDIYAANADGTDPIRLTSEKEDHSPIWSPDGTKIAYVHGWDDKAQIWVMNTDGSDPQQLTDQRDRTPSLPGRRTGPRSRSSRSTARTLIST